MTEGADVFARGSTLLVAILFAIRLGVFLRQVQIRVTKVVRCLYLNYEVLVAVEYVLIYSNHEVLRLVLLESVE